MSSKMENSFATLAKWEGEKPGGIDLPNGGIAKAPNRNVLVGYGEGRILVPQDKVKEFAAALYEQTRDINDNTDPQRAISVARNETKSALSDVRSLEEQLARNENALRDTKEERAEIADYKKPWPK